MKISPASIGIIFNDKNQILLVQRKDIPLWVLPGGGIDLGETPEQAVIREIFEETGLKVSIERKSGEYTPTNSLGSFTNVFVCKILEGSLTLSDETNGINFFPLNNLPPFLFPLHKNWIEDALNSTTLVKKPLTGISYWDALKYLLKHPIMTLKYLLTRLSKRNH